MKIIHTCNPADKNRTSLGKILLRLFQIRDISTITFLHHANGYAWLETPIQQGSFWHQKRLRRTVSTQKRFAVPPE